jgi:hypothetical protein
MTDRADRCPSCRGRGRKFVLLRRSSAMAGGASERGLLFRSWVRCLTCSGTGRVVPS